MKPPTQEPLAQDSYGRLLIYATVIGLVGGALALLYYWVLKLMLHLLWARAVGVHWLDIGSLATPQYEILFATTFGGLLVGLSMKYLGAPGEIAAVVDNIHLESGKIDVNQTPSMVVNSLLSISAGGSAGPEAPLVQIIGSFGSWLGDRLKLRNGDVRTLTFCGMSTALGAFFGSPLGGALFSLEIPHRRSMEYYEALVPSILASLCGFFVFRSVLGYHGPLYPFADPYLAPNASSDLFLRSLLWGVGLGMLGAVLAVVFSVILRGSEVILHPLSRFPIALGALGGLALGALALVAPRTLFWGEFQTEALIRSAPIYLLHHSIMATALFFVGIALIKMVAVAITLHSGFRGGFIFPLFFIGAAVGISISAIMPSVPVAISVVCLMASVNVAVTKTPISSVVILSTLTGTGMIPVLITSSLTSFLLTTRLSVIPTQRSRGHVTMKDAQVTLKDAIDL